MPTRDLVAKYGRGRNISSHSAINAAIRAELVGGDHCLDALNALDQLKQKYRDRGWTDHLAEINAAISAVHEVARSMRAEVRARYGMPPE